MDTITVNANIEKSADERAREIPVRVTSLGDTISTLEMVVETLEKRLAPALTGEEEPVGPDQPRDPMQTEIGATLDSFEYRLGRIGNRLVSVTTRCEI